MGKFQLSKQWGVGGTLDPTPKTPPHPTLPHPIATPLFLSLEIVCLLTKTNKLQ